MFTIMLSETTYSTNSKLVSFLVTNCLPTHRILP